MDNLSVAIIMVLGLMALSSTCTYLWVQLRYSREQTKVALEDLEELKQWVEVARDAVATIHGDSLGDLAAAWMIPSIRHQQAECDVVGES